MDIMQIAAAVSITDVHNLIRGVTGPFGSDPENQVAELELTNGYRLSLRKDGPDTAEILVCREINDVSAPDGVSTVSDYSTPVANDVARRRSVDGIAEAVRVLSGLVNDPYDVSTRRPAGYCDEL